MRARRTQAVLGALAALVGFAAMTLLIHSGRLGLTATESLQFMWTRTSGWSAHLAVVGALLGVLTAAACAYTHPTPTQPRRPLAEVGLAALLSAAGFFIVVAATDVVGYGGLAPQCVAAALLGGGLGATGGLARVHVDRATSSRRGLPIALVVAGVGALVSYLNYIYAWNMVLGRGPDEGLKQVLAGARLGPAWLGREAGPLGLALAVPLVAHALGRGLPAQAFLALAGVAALERLLGLRGPDWHSGGRPMDIEEVGACLVALAVACAARFTREPPPP